METGYRSLNKLILSSLLLAIALPTTSMARSFDIELLVFKRNDTSNESKERWDTELKMPAFSKSDELIYIEKDNCLLATSDCSENIPSQPLSPKAISSPVKGRHMLSRGQLRMNYLRKKLSRHSAYAPLLHIGWREAVKSPRKAQYVHLFGGQNFAWQFNDKGDLVSITAQDEQPAKKGISLTAESTEVKVIETPTAQKNKIPIWELDGLAKVSLNTYLYMDFDLLLREVDEREVTLTPFSPIEQGQDNPEVDNAEPNLVIEARTDRDELSMTDEMTEAYLQNYSLKQKRRLKSGETHYFDHPKFGVILQIRKLTKKTNKVDQ